MNRLIHANKHEDAASPSSAGTRFASRQGPMRPIVYKRFGMKCIPPAIWASKRFGLLDSAKGLEGFEHAVKPFRYFS